MSYSDFLKARREVLSEDGIEGIIDLANITAKGKKLEANPKKFFDLTYPTADIKRVIEKLHNRYNSSSGEGGLFLFEGFKGSGKSHLLLLVYHLFKNPKEAKEWLAKHKLQCVLPDDVTVVINKFTDLPLESIWNFICEAATNKRLKETIVQPNLQDVQKALAGKKLIIIFDELEQGIGVINNDASRRQNIAFLQMLSEWANRETQITMFASIYSDREEPGSTLKRVGPVSVKFTHMQDKAKVVLHRLFENYQAFDNAQVDSLLESYLNLWKKHIPLFNALAYKKEMKDAFPFLPELLKIVLEKVPARGGFQNVRGALGFLANMVKLTYEKTDIITAAHASLADRETRYRLSDLDPAGDLINRAKANFDELKSVPLSLEISSAVLLYTLTDTGRMRGVTKDELIRNTMNCDTDINEFESALLSFQKYGSHFWIHEGRFYFDVEENPDAKVEFRSLSISEQQAKEHLSQLWKEEIFKETNNCVIFDSIDTTKTILEDMEKDRIRFVFAPRCLTSEERHDLYHGITNRNLVLLLEPKDKEFNLLQNQDLLAWSKRQIAALELAGMTEEAERRNEYERICREDRKYCLDLMRRAGISYIRWENYGDSYKTDQTEEEPLSSSSKEDVLRFISETIYPAQVFCEHLIDRISDTKGKTAKEVEQVYRNTIGYPVPIFYMLTKGIRALCKEKRIGIQHSRGNYCGEDPGLTETELLQAIITEPFETGQPQHPTTPPGGGKPVIPVGVHPPKPGTPSVKIESVTIPYQPGISALRQTLASKVQEYEDARVLKVNFTIYLPPSTTDLGAFPSAYRGNIAGEGELGLEIGITKSGNFSKGQVESLVESLPNIKNAEYGAKLEIQLNSEETNASEQ